MSFDDVELVRQVEVSVANARQWESPRAMAKWIIGADGESAEVEVARLIQGRDVLARELQSFRGRVSTLVADLASKTTELELVALDRTRVSAERDDALAKADRHERDWVEAKHEFGTATKKLADDVSRLTSDLERVRHDYAATGAELTREGGRRREAWERVDELERIHGRLVGDLSAAGVVFAGVADAVGTAVGPGLVVAVRQVVAERTLIAGELHAAREDHAAAVDAWKSIRDRAFEQRDAARTELERNGDELAKLRSALADMTAERDVARLAFQYADGAQVRLAALLAYEAGALQSVRVELAECHRQREHWRTRATRAESIKARGADKIAAFVERVFGSGIIAGAIRRGDWYAATPGPAIVDQDPGDEDRA